jgi:EpsI family protein
MGTIMTARNRFMLFYLLLLATWASLQLQVRAAVPVARPLADFPKNWQKWRMTSQTRFSEDILKVLKPTDYLSRRYEEPNGRNIGLYIGYHDGGRGSGKIHSPRHCLPGSGWQQESTERMELAGEKGGIRLVKAVYRKGDTRELFLYWFQVREKTMSDEYSLKLAEMTNAIRHGRRDAAFIRISVPFGGDEEEAAAVGVAFIRDFLPLIRGYLPS